MITKNDNYVSPVDFLARQAIKGGPAPEEYLEFDLQLDEWQESLESNPDELEKVTRHFDEEFYRSTLLGFSRKKPFGYPGDFKIIDMIYTHSVDSKYANWDRYFHQTGAARAVRNRKQYFKDWVLGQYAKRGRLSILHLATGPGRDIAELFQENETLDITFDCVESDARAIEYCRALNPNPESRIRYFQQNAFRFKPKRKYDLIWAGGLLDYFSDEEGVKLLKRTLAWTHADGEVVLGNFNTSNPAKTFMETLLDWRLNHRDMRELCALAIRGGAHPLNIYVGREPLNINLFLHIGSAAGT